jgi:hypothetical protein
MPRLRFRPFHARQQLYRSCVHNSSPNRPVLSADHLQRPPSRSALAAAVRDADEEFNQTREAQTDAEAEGARVPTRGLPFTVYRNHRRAAWDGPRRSGHVTAPAAQ